MAEETHSMPETCIQAASALINAFDAHTGLTRQPATALQLHTSAEMLAVHAYNSWYQANRHSDRIAAHHPRTDSRQHPGAEQGKGKRCD